MSRQVSIQDIRHAKTEGRKLVMLTAYDYPFGLMSDESEVDIVLVGDSLGMVVMGHTGTEKVTMEEMIHHIKAVVNGCQGPLVVGDMPFGSYHVSMEQAVGNAVRLVKEGGCDVVKLEGGVDIAPTVKAIVKAGVPVQGHIGLTPQTATALGGFKMQGKNAAAAKQIYDDAMALEKAGVFSIILEAVPAPLGKVIAESVSVPVIDMVGLFDKFLPKFVKQYAQIREVILEAFAEYKKEVLSGAFPGPEHTFTMSDQALDDLKTMIASDQG